MEKFWSYITTLLAGVVAGLLIFLKLKNPETVINDNTRIGKMKQRGQGNEAAVTIDPQLDSKDAVNIKSGKEKREERKANRIARRRERQEKRQCKSP
jgi:hypothetical protein